MRRRYSPRGVEAPTRTVTPMVSGPERDGMAETVGENEISTGTPLIDSESANVMFSGLEEVPVIWSWNWADEPTAIGVEVAFDGAETSNDGTIESLTNPTLLPSMR